ncbi:hypothetical protein ACIQKB_37670 [Streptomyces sp. NPDC092046]|uniref:hypothetical protein n=1 Tax=Streptomyces sp. NPDC092046 TaxID=3366009 RepID=UPI0038156A58
MTRPITEPTALDAHTERLLTRAAELEQRWYTVPQMWTGSTGTPTAPHAVVAFLEDAVKRLDQDGWEPRKRGLQQLLDGGFGNVAHVSVSVLELIICADSRINAALPLAWDLVPGRTVAEVRTLLQTGTAYARRTAAARS